MNSPPNPKTTFTHELTIVVTTDQQNVAEGDLLWQSYYDFMRHSQRDVLITFSLAKGPERSNPLDPASPETGRTTYALSENCRTANDLTQHWHRAAESWPDFNAFIAWMQRPDTQVVTLHDGQVQNSLW
ncbi:hypothetical protein [Streptomyces chryseus]